MSFFVLNNNMKILRDSSNGKETDWKGKKSRSILVARHLYLADPRFRKKADRMAKCAEYLTFKVTDKGLRLNQCYFCKGRLCPMCNWRRSMKIAFQNKKIVEEANKRYKLKWVFLTLTVRNCEADKLSKTINDMMKSWNRFAGYKRFKDSVRGYFRALEVTKDTDKYISKKRYYRNRKYYDRRGLKPGSENPNFGTYHPHFHILMCVPPSFYTYNYVKQSEWCEMWKKAMKLDYIPIVDVRKVKPKENVDFEKIEQEIKDNLLKEIEEQKAVLEVSKYPIKDTDLIGIGDKITKEGIETVRTLETSLFRKRLISYGGILKTLHSELQLDDAEEGDLIHTGEDPEANAIGEVIAYWNSGIKDYVILKEYEYKGDKKIDLETGEILDREADKQ